MYQWALSCLPSVFFSFCKKRCDWNFWIQMSASLVLLLWFFFIAPSCLSKFFPGDIFLDDTLMLCDKHSISWALTIKVFLIFFKKEWWNTGTLNCNIFKFWPLVFFCCCSCWWLYLLVFTLFFGFGPEICWFEAVWLE